MRRRLPIVPKLAERTDPGFGGNAPYYKEQGQRTDQRPEKYEIQIQSKGYRLCWTRASRCPCASINKQTMQPSPNCPLCDSKGWFWYGDKDSQNITPEDKFTPSQSRVLEETGGYVMRGLMSSMTREQNPLDKLGHWISGTANLTVSAFSRISYYDRLINLDSVMAYSEVVEMPDDPAHHLPTKYIVAGGVYIVRSVTTRFAPEQDYYVKKGAIYMNRGLRTPPAGTRLSVHYLCHPAWLVMTEPHATRGTNLLTRAKNKISREGSFYDLPIQAIVRLEFLAWPGGGNEE